MKLYKCEVHVFYKGEILQEIKSDNLYSQSRENVLKRLNQVVDLIRSKASVEMVVAKLNNEMVICK